MATDAGKGSPMVTTTGIRRVWSRRVLALGAVGGLIAGVAMAMFAMIAGATYQGTGFFTPMYHIASPLIGDETMKRSMQDGRFYFQLGPALLGLTLHMMTSVIYGVIFALLARSVRLRGAAAVLAGAIYGLAVMLFMSFLVLPVTADVVGGGAAVRDMPRMVGWTSFTIEHVIYGGVLGLLPWVRSSDFA